MTHERKRLLILLGPVTSVVFGGLAIVANTDSTLFVYGVFGAVAFMLVPPPIQVGMLATQRFSGRDFLACAVGMAVPTLFLGVELVLGLLESY
jgi:hypothetical protein